MRIMIAPLEFYFPQAYNSHLLTPPPDAAC
jgi:hypothetical protein